MPTLPPDPGRVHAALRAVLGDVLTLLAADPRDERLMAALRGLRSAEEELHGYADQARPLR